MFNFNQPRSRTKASTIVAYSAAFLLLVTLAVAQQTQIPRGFAGKKIVFTHYEGVSPRALITAKDAKPLPGGNVLALDFMLTTFRDGNPTNIEAVIETPESIF